MKYLKNPFVVIAIGLSVLFFVPFPAQYLPLKIVVGLMIFSYALSLGAFKEKGLFEHIEEKDHKKRLKEVEKNLEEMEAKKNNK